MPSKPASHRPPHWKPDAVRARSYDRERNRRDPGRKLIFSERWRLESKAFLARPENRWCACGRCQPVRPADMVDHRKPHRGDLALFWDRENWQPMDIRCHSGKTNREDGGFGNPSG